MNKFVNQDNIIMVAIALIAGVVNESQEDEWSWASLSSTFILVCMLTLVIRHFFFKKPTAKNKSMGKDNG